MQKSKVKNVILIGFMGAGKSEVGEKLALKLDMDYINTDDIIEREEGKKISQIFKDRGESYFRDLETKLLDAISEIDNTVISTGGGMVLRKENVEKLKRLGPLILLSAREEVIAERLKNVRNRPLLDVPDPKAKIKEILEFRNPIYNAVADFKVDTSDLDIETAVEKILNYLKT